MNGYGCHSRIAQRVKVRFAAIILALSGAGCAVEAGVEVDGPAMQPDGLSLNGWANNGLPKNGLTTNSITMNGLTSNALAQNGLQAASIDVEDDLQRQTFAYLVECALPAGSEVTLHSASGSTHTFPGAIGLAPEWQHGACDETCQGWVSACMIARVNFNGEHVTISMRGDYPGTGLDVTREELRAFPYVEGAYYGNIFKGQAFACQASKLISRVCGPDVSKCAVEVVGVCDVNCGAASGTGGFWSKCPDPRGTFHDAITVYRAPRSN